MRKNYYTLSTATGKSDTYSPFNQAGMVLITVLYGILVLGAATVGSYHIYQWARWAVIDSYSISSSLSLPAPSSEQEQTAVAINETAEQTEANAASRAETTLSPVNILLLGTDDRVDETGPARTDTMILLTLDPQASTVGMLSLTRDTWVTIPGQNMAAKINMAYSIGEQNKKGTGTQLVIDTVSNFIGHPVDYYVKINFQGFVELVDLIGGIDIIVPKTIHDEEYPTANYGVETFHLEQGLQQLDGETALKYARTRHVDDDYGRARRQQDVIRAVLDKVTRADMIASLLPQAWKLVSTMRSSIETNMPIALQLELAGYMRDASLREIRQEVIDDRFGTINDSSDAGWILIPDRDKVRAAVDRFFSPSLAADPTASVDPHWVRIEILNGTGEWGIAARTRDLLQKQGWQVVSIDDADRSDYTQSIIINYGVPSSVVADVGADMGIASSVATLQGLNSSHPVDLRIVVGRDLLSTLQ